MAMEPERWSNLATSRGRSSGRVRAKPKGYQDFYLCVALVVLLAWAVAVGLGVW